MRDALVPLLIVCLGFAIIAAVWYVQHPPSREQDLPQDVDPSTPRNLASAIEKCDTKVRTQLVPSTLESLAAPQWNENDIGGFAIRRSISVVDKRSRRYSYEYFCIATPNGEGGIGQVSASLVLSNR
jgi:hypothetical protein